MKKTNRQSKISTALMGAMLLLVSLIMVCSVYSVISFQMIGNNLTTFCNVEYVTTKDQMEIRKDVQTIIKRVLWAAISMDPSVTKEQRDDTNERFVKMEKYVDTIKTNLADEALGASIDSNLKKFEDSTYKMLDMVDAGNFDDVVAYYESDFLNISEALADVLGEAGADSDAAVQRKYDRSVTIQTTVTVILIIISAISLILALILVRYLTLRIVKPVKACADRLHLLVKKGDLHTEVPESRYQDETGMMLMDMGETITYFYGIVKLMSEHLESIAKGDLSKRNDFSFDGDFASLSDSLGVIYNSLNEIMGQINRTSDEVAMGSDQVASGAQALSQGATEQAASVEELAATIVTISENIRDNASYAKSASQRAVSVKETAGESSRSMQEMLSAMTDISDSSGEIGKIIKTIEDIAFQTNILALNAAVEAARAGTAGKGFAVVADEVRNLAGKSAAASKNTAELIEGSLQAVQRGTDIASETAKAMDGLTEGVQDITRTIDQISAASEAQSDIMAQVNMGIDQISSVVQTNSATAEEDAAASEELSSQAKILKELVGRFKLRR